VYEVGPISKEECLAKWFFASEDPEACAIMNESVFSNAEFCSEGCCCSLAPEGLYGVDYTPSTKAECTGESERWAPYSECGSWVCMDIVPGLSPPEPGQISGQHYKRPTMAPIGDKAVHEGELLEIQVYADGEQPITYSASSLPRGASFNPEAGSFSWTPGPGSARFTYVNFTASNKYGEDFREVRIDVFGESKGERIILGLIGAIVLAVIALIACFFGLAALVSGIIGIAGVFGLILGGAIAVVGAGIIGFALGLLVSLLF
jgi:hypothetical protein